MPLSPPISNVLFNGRSASEVMTPLKFSDLSFVIEYALPGSTEG